MARDSEVVLAMQSNQPDHCIACGTTHVLADDCPAAAFATIVCECGAEFELPLDAMFAIYDLMQCGACGKSGRLTKKAAP